MRKSIRGKLIFTYLLLIVIVILILGLFLLNFLRDNYLKNLQDSLYAQAGLVAHLAGDTFESPGGEAYLKEMAVELSREVGVRVTLMDGEGKVLGDSDEDPALMENHINRREIKKALEEGVGVVSRFSKTLDTDMLYLAVPVKGEEAAVTGFVRVALPLTEVNQALQRIWIIIAGFIIAASLISGIVGLKFAASITRPLEEMTEKAKEIARGNFNERIYTPEENEIGQLGEAFNYMARTLKEKVNEILKGKNQLESLLSSVSSGIILLDREGKIVLSNPAAEAIISFSHQEVAGRSHLSLIRDYKLSRKVEKVMEKGQVDSLELTLNYPYEKILEVNLAPVKDARGEVTGQVMVFHDITEIRRLEKIRRDFIANVSHELRTPVTAVKGFAETLLEEDTLKDPQAVKEFASIINQEGERLNRLIGDLLELSKIEGQGSMTFAPVDLKGVAEETVKKMKRAANLKELDLELEIPSSPLYVLGDEDKIHQVFSNLLDNSIKYTPGGGKIRVVLEEEENQLKVLVEDTGMGIPQEEIPRIFERFYRVDKTRSRKYGGTGLGLTIVKHIVEAHHGSIWVESIPSRGTRFYFTLPRRSPQE
ncbi:MAG: HAMP domain-containing histidine kinase [Candidatus Syntrophonatronum acetioxidans]|uniref:histidine kinase n=1 Tax=Candidatus Syntrophonatronum acetioxidans TaxID=1795816 RepID=A0A424YFD1_9FIRM|nr:MAG: HAMP domain-containing histidine kinase [Candidatus Syntrophonatronum acetioxidans]